MHQVSRLSQPDPLRCVLQPACPGAVGSTSFLLQCEEDALDVCSSASSTSSMSQLASNPIDTPTGFSCGSSLPHAPAWPHDDSRDYMHHLRQQEAETRLLVRPLKDHLPTAECHRFAVHRHRLVNWLTDLAFQEGCSSDALFLAVACMDRCCSCRQACTATATDRPTSDDLPSPSSSEAAVMCSSPQPLTPPPSPQPGGPCALLPRCPCGCLCTALQHPRWCWLVALACLWAATKYEDAAAPPARLFLASCPVPFDQEQLLDAEVAVLQQLSYRLSGLATTKSFLRALTAGHAARAPLPTELHYMAGYLAEISLLEYQLLDTAPSMVAAAAYCTAWLLLWGQAPDPAWASPQLLGYTLPQLEPTGQMLLALYLHLAEAARAANPYACTLKYLLPEMQQLGGLPLPLRLPNMALQPSEAAGGSGAAGST